MVDRGVERSRGRVDHTRLCVSDRDGSGLPGPTTRGLWIRSGFYGSRVSTVGIGSEQEPSTGQVSPTEHGGEDCCRGGSRRESFVECRWRLRDTTETERRWTGVFRGPWGGAATGVPGWSASRVEETGTWRRGLSMRLSLCTFRKSRVLCTLFVHVCVPRGDPFRAGVGSAHRRSWGYGAGPDRCRPGTHGPRPGGRREASTAVVGEE